MKRLILLFLLTASLCVSQNSYAQDYSSAIGLRLGYPLSLSYKTFLNDQGAVEVFGGIRGFSTYSWVNIGGAYQHHQDISGVEGLNWYIGGGASVFFWNFKDSFFGDNSSSTTFGILGNIGLDYTFPETPINVSVDWMPIYFINGFGNGFGGGYGGLAIRYVLGR